MLIFEDFLPLKRTLVIALSEMGALTSRKYAEEHTKSNQNNSNLMNYFGCIPQSLL